ncbi:hypothetical protein PR048_002561 [Dryococelus australis]|uniref:Uncharacterized protein n=1 Tax=Dryococelus australis TaxID=614101 RepID=A0ABQ9IKH5_9NEOP|nr:hypothetical protein PR048_002561 [Dryococelus australis]
MLKPAAHVQQRRAEFTHDCVYASDSRTLMCQILRSNKTYKKNYHINLSTKQKCADSNAQVQTSMLSLVAQKEENWSIMLPLKLKLLVEERKRNQNILLDKLFDPSLSWMDEFIEDARWYHHIITQVLVLGAGDFPCVKSLREKYVPVAAQ